MVREQRGEERPGRARGFGQELRRHRAGRGLSQDELAERAGLSAKAVGALERGERRRLHPRTVDLLAAALDLTAEERRALRAAARGLVTLPGPGAPPGRAAPRHNLPLHLTSFVGREAELAEVRRLLRATRLLTLTGTGGCGKARLALEVAAGLVDAYPDGVWLVELAPLADAALVPDAVATALGARGDPAQPTHANLLSFLRQRQLLLALDNCEHLIDACARLADTILRGCPRVRIVATSREALRVAGEAVLRVPSLPLPPPLPDAGTGGRRDAVNAIPASWVEEVARADAVRLFLDRAGAVRSGFTLTAANAVAVAQVCRRLDGIPLALELAVARTSALSVERIAARLDRRFRLLTGGSRAALPRQQTLAAAVGWSYGLLTEPERTLFHRLAVFAGGFDLEAAEQVCADAPLAAEDVLDLLSGLVEKSLVVAEPGEGGVERYTLLETLRAYARARLAGAGEADRVRDRHRAWYTALAERIAPELFGPSEVAAFGRLTAEHDTLRGALAWCGERDADAGLRLAVNLGHFWESRGYEAEGRRWLEAMLARASPDPLPRMQALWRIATWLSHQGDIPAATPRAEEGLLLAREGVVWRRRA